MPDRWVTADDPDLPEDVWLNLWLIGERERIERALKLHCIRNHHSDDLRSCNCPNGGIRRWMYLLYSPNVVRA